jgi:tRNA threonylcarbamoyladenosine biosynthesis protein TsaE
MSAEFSKDNPPLAFPAGILETGSKWTAVTQSPEETQQVGRSLAQRLAPPCVILLEGELGAGKTTLAKGIVAGLGAAGEEEVTSPTFALVHEYGPGGVYHVDLYRIETAAELETLGLDDILAGNTVVLVEWGEKLKRGFAGRAVRVRMEYAGENQRRITVES